MDDIENAKKFFVDNPDIEILEAFVIDANGVPRGKWIPRERAIDVLEKGMAIPRSVMRWIFGAVMSTLRASRRARVIRTASAFPFPAHCRV